MEVRIGRALDGSPFGVDTASTSVLVLVGDPGAGRPRWPYLARWWIADPLPTAATAVGEQTARHPELGRPPLPVDQQLGHGAVCAPW